MTEQHLRTRSKSYLHLIGSSFFLLSQASNTILGGNSKAIKEELKKMSSLFSFEKQLLH